MIYLRFIAPIRRIFCSLPFQYFEEACIVTTVIVTGLPMIITGGNEDFPFENSIDALTQLLACVPRYM